MIFRHSGEIGDLVFLMPLLRALKGQHSIYLVDRVKEPPFSRSILGVSDFIIPLFKEQPYIKEIRCTEDKPDIDMSKFRVFHTPTTTLTAAQVSYYNDQTGDSIKEDGSDPWLSVNGERVPSGRVVISRSSRYNNPRFPWERVVKHYGKRILFIGLPHEHKSFQSKYGTVKHQKVQDLLEMAHIIRNAELFIGNQSSPQSVAMGFGGRIIQETFVHQTDCIFPRRNVQYCYDGGCILPDVDGSGQLNIESEIQEMDLSVNRSIVPPGHWQFPGSPSFPHFKDLSNIVMQSEKCDRDQADKMIIIHNMKRCPDFFGTNTIHPDNNAMIAIKNANLPLYSLT